MKVDFNLGYTNLIIREAEQQGMLRNQLAYALATAYHETGFSMEPIKETVQINHKDRNPSDEEVIARLDRAFARGQLPWVSRPYWKDGHFGRGFVQLTHLHNYEKATKKLGVNFVEDPDKALEPCLAAKILIIGMQEGWFTGKKISDYITLQKSNFKSARRVVNGLDRASEIAEYARAYDKALLEELEYGVE